VNMTETLDRLGLRVDELEKEVIGGPNVEGKESVKDISLMVAKINMELMKIDRNHTIIHDFFQRYNQIKSFIVAPPEEILLSNNAKLAIVLSCEEFIKQTTDLLKSVQELEKFINPSTLQTVPTLIKQLKPIEMTHLEQKEVTACMSERVDHQTKSYNKIINLISDKFVYWDYMLSTWEQTLAGQTVK